MLTTMLMGAALAATGQVPATKINVRDSNAIYSQTTAADGSTILQGQYRDTGKRFRLTVTGDQVRGWVGGKPVSFGTSELETILR